MEDFQILQKEQYTITKEFLQGLKNCIGKPYIFNCFDETGFDCYTLIYYLYKLVGIKLPKENIAAYNLKIHSNLINKHKILFKQVPYKERKFLDILLFSSSDKINAHLGLVLSSELFIHVNLGHTVRIEYFTNNLESLTIRKVYRWNSLN
jgi:cell wall-associated NlpC family hydrolase